MILDIAQILILDDDEKFLNGVVDFVQKSFENKIEILTAKNVEEAEALLEAHASTLDVFVCDLMMADGKPGGLELATRMAPRMPVIAFSAFPPKSYDGLPERLGPVIFLEKSASKQFRAKLIEAIHLSIQVKQFGNRANDEVRELRSLSLSRTRGAILAARFRLPEITPADLPKYDLRNMDFAAIALGAKFFESSIEASGGRVHSMHDQSMWASFHDTSPEQEGVKNAIEAFEKTVGEVDGEWKAGFEQCPFGAAVVPGLLVSGLFGQRSPGIPAIVGRTGDIGFQMALRAKPHEIAVVREWLTTRRRRWFDRFAAGKCRVETCGLTHLSAPVEITFYHP